METIVSVLFSNEVDAYKCQKALQRLDDNEEVSLNESYIITRPESGGEAVIKSAKGEQIGRGTVGGMLIGGLLGLLGGPIGVLIGGSTGMLIGLTDDVVRSTDIDEHLDGLARRVLPGKTLLVAHLWEDYTAPVDAALKSFHGEIARFDVAMELRKAADMEVVLLDRDIALADREWQQSSDAAKADRKAALDELKRKRNDARSRFEAQVDQQKKRYQGWLDGQRKKFNTWKSGVEADRDQSKRERLEKRIASQQEKLDELHTELQSV